MHKISHSSSPGGIIQAEFGSENGGMAGSGGYTSARYESLREAEDVTLEDWLNSRDKVGDVGIFGRVVRGLGLAELLDQSVMTLSYGQARRARIAVALLKRPQALLINEPFTGLDPPTIFSVSHFLQEIAPRPQNWFALATTPVLAFRPKDPVPSWVDNVAVLGEEYNVLSMGPREDVIKEMQEVHNTTLNTSQPWDPKGGLFEEVWKGVDMLGEQEEIVSPDTPATPDTTSPTTPAIAPINADTRTGKEALVSLSKIMVKYGDSPPRYVLQNFTWTIRRGDRWGLFGRNGSGKTTLLSLLTSDHPQTYSQDITIFGKKRCEPGVSVFDIQSQIGQTSPEILGCFPRHLSLRRVVESAWAEAPLSKPVLLKGAEQAITKILSYFGSALPNKPESIPFADLTPTQQRLALFIRAVVKKPKLLILDEALAGMDPDLREKCLAWLDPVEKGGMGGLEEGQALVAVSQVEEELPRGLGWWVRLGKKPEFGPA